MSPVVRANPDDFGAAAPRETSEKADARLRQMFEAHFDFTWRSLRRFGLREDVADDAAQRVFMIASQKLAVIRPGSEQSFLFGTAMRVASDIRRSAPHRRETPHADPAAGLEGGDRPDEIVEQRRARALLDDALDTLDEDLRSVFVLFELEEMSTTEIASLLELPRGTVASRLRRARTAFTEAVEKLQRARVGEGRPR